MTNETLDTVNNLPSVTMIAGQSMRFIFNCVDANGAAINITSAQISIKICPYGQPTLISITRNGSFIAPLQGSWRIDLVAADTAGLYGTYLAQPRIIDTDGNTFQPSQFILNIVALIA